MMTTIRCAVRPASRTNVTKLSFISPCTQQVCNYHASRSLTRSTWSSGKIVNDLKYFQQITIPETRTMFNTNTTLRQYNTAPLANQTPPAKTTHKQPSPPSSSPRKQIDVTIVGAPNAGKSQLLNSLLQTKLAAVSRKRHTTREGIMGLRTVENTQIVFMDTPGYLRLRTAKKEKLMRDLVVSAMKEMSSCDYVVLVIDAAKDLGDDLLAALTGLMLKAIYGTPTGRFAIVLNKIDLVRPKTKLLDVARTVGDLAMECLKLDNVPELARMLSVSESEALRLRAKFRNDDVNGDDDDDDALASMFPETFFVSALRDDGTDDVLQFLLSQATPGEWLIDCGDDDNDRDGVTDMTTLERVEEIIREKIYRAVHREVPHQVHQVNRVFELVHERRGNGTVNTNKPVGIRIDQDLVVHTRSHARILTGKKRMTVQGIQLAARKDLEKMFNASVQLNLHVKLDKNHHGRQLVADRPMHQIFDDSSDSRGHDPLS